jgi:hypothetical protein
MKPFTLMLAAVANASLLCACATSIPPGGPPARVDLCEDGHAWQDELAALDTSAVLKVAPTYWVDTCAGASQVSGTRLLIRLRGTSTERLTHMLGCSRVRVQVGKDEGARAEDHLQLPEGWVDVEVTREIDAYSVWISAESVTKNLELARRAKTAFARASGARTAR